MSNSDRILQDEHFIEIEDTPSYTTAFNQLVFASKKPLDPFLGAIPNPKLHLAGWFKTFSEHKQATVYPKFHRDPGSISKPKFHLKLKYRIHNHLIIRCVFQLGSN